MGGGVAGVTCCTSYVLRVDVNWGGLGPSCMYVLGAASTYASTDLTGRSQFEERRNSQVVVKALLLSVPVCTIHSYILL